MNTKLLGCLAASAMAVASVVATPALAFRGGGGFGGGGFHGGFGGGGFRGGFGGGGFRGGFGGGGFRGGIVTGRSVFVPGGNRFVGTPFAGRHVFANRRSFENSRRDRIEDRREGRRDRIEDRREGRRDRIEDRREGRRDRIEDRREDRFRHRRFFVNGFDDFAFFGVPFAYDYAAYGNGCWRWDGSQWINICYGYGY